MSPHSDQVAKRARHHVREGQRTPIAMVQAQRPLGADPLARRARQGNLPGGGLLDLVLQAAGGRQAREDRRCRFTLHGPERIP